MSWVTGKESATSNQTVGSAVQAGGQVRKAGGDPGTAACHKMSLPQWVMVSGSRSTTPNLTCVISSIGPTTRKERTFSPFVRPERLSQGVQSSAV